jgi:cyclopropane fatty-acyl-phospholipid synthase-like methyltransferase
VEQPFASQPRSAKAFSVATPDRNPSPMARPADEVIPYEVDSEIIRRYEKNYGISGVAAEMIRKHWRIERQLTAELRRSDKDTRWDTFERCYTELYQNCPWLNSAEPVQDDIHSEFEIFARLLGGARTVYEIGSGNGALIRFLASRDFNCVGSEITKERGGKLVAAEHNLRWANSDGVNLGRFEPHDYYDAVVSTQVIEHLHPEDIPDHFRGVFVILANGGKYIFDTPHYLHGPSDLSKVFRAPEAMCMHLKEYYYGELRHHLQAAGFDKIKAVFAPPRRIRRRLPFYIESAIYLEYNELVERVARALGKGRIPRPVLWLMLPSANIFLTAMKPRC